MFSDGSLSYAYNIHGVVSGASRGLDMELRSRIFVTRLCRSGLLNTHLYIYGLLLWMFAASQ